MSLTLCWLKRRLADATDQQTQKDILVGLQLQLKQIQPPDAPPLNITPMACGADIQTVG